MKTGLKLAGYLLLPLFIIGWVAWAHSSFWAAPVNVANENNGEDRDLPTVVLAAGEGGKEDRVPNFIGD